MATIAWRELFVVIVGVGLAYAAAAQSNGTVVTKDRETVVLQPGNPALAATGASNDMSSVQRLASNPAATDSADGDRDPDGDGLTSQEEGILGADPNNADTDGDGLFDGVEVALELDPLLAQTTDGTDDAGLDTDGDGYSNLEEQSRGYNPADHYDSPAVPGWPQQNCWADGSTLWRDHVPEESP